MKKVHNPRQGTNFHSSAGKKTLACFKIELRQFTSRIVRCYYLTEQGLNSVTSEVPSSPRLPWSYKTFTLGLCNTQPPWPYTAHQGLSLAKHNTWITNLFVLFHLCRPKHLPGMSRCLLAGGTWWPGELRGGGLGLGYQDYSSAEILRLVVLPEVWSRALRSLGNGVHVQGLQDSLGVIVSSDCWHPRMSLSCW